MVTLRVLQAVSILQVTTALQCRFLDFYLFCRQVFVTNPVAFAAGPLIVKTSLKVGRIAKPAHTIRSYELFGYWRGEVADQYYGVLLGVRNCLIFSLESSMRNLVLHTK